MRHPLNYLLLGSHAAGPCLQPLPNSRRLVSSPPASRTRPPAGPRTWRCRFTIRQRPAARTPRSRPSRVAGRWWCSCRASPTRRASTPAPGTTSPPRGYVVVINNTGSTNPDLQAADGDRALQCGGVGKRQHQWVLQGCPRPEAGRPRRAFDGGWHHRAGPAPATRVTWQACPWHPWDLKLLFNRDYPKSYSPSVKVPLTIVHGQG